jgi:NDP-sugar pyrophosphorylase family protein
MHTRTPILDLIPKGENRSFEYNVFPTILGKACFFGYVMDNEYWRYRNAEYLAAHRDMLAGSVTGFEIDRSAAPTWRRGWCG